MRVFIRKIIIWGAVALAIASFFVCFGAGIKGTVLGVDTEIKSLIFGTQKTYSTIHGTTNSVEIKEPVYAVICQIGAILVLVGALFAGFLGTFTKKLKIKFLLRLAGLAVLVGAILILFVKPGWISSTISDMFKDSSASESVIENAKELLEETYEDYSNNAATILASILGILSAGLIGFASFIPSKKR